MWEKEEDEVELEDEEENNGLKKEKEDETTEMKMVVKERNEGRMKSSRRTKRLGKMKKS